MANNQPERKSDTAQQADGAAQEKRRQAADANAQVADPLEELESLRDKLAESQDKLLRTQAELENYRKRSRRELEDERRFAEIHLVRDLLPIVDNLSRAIEAAEKNADAGKLLEGFKMMQKQFEQVFAQHHCKLITAEVVGEPSTRTGTRPSCSSRAKSTRIILCLASPAPASSCTSESSARRK